eukprot:213549-Prorocentrum_minimum.AAC.1
MKALEINGSKEVTFDQTDLASGISNFNGHLTLQATVVETATRETQVRSDAEVTEGGARHI